MTDREKINEIHAVLCGSELHPNGLIKRVTELEEFKSKALKTLWTATGVIITVGTILKLV